MTGALTALTLAQARDLLSAGEVSARELTQAHLDAIEAARTLNAFITVTPDLALRLASEADARHRSGETRGALDGMTAHEIAAVPRRDAPSVVVECCCGHSWTEDSSFSVHEPVRCPKCHWFGCMSILKEVP